MKFPDEPAGWQCLHAMAECAPDTKSLARIVSEMNRILDEHQKTAEGQPQRTTVNRMGSPAVQVVVRVAE